MTIWHIIGGVVLLLLGGFPFVVLLAVTAFSVGFGGTSIAGGWFLIPTVVTFGGPFLMWYWLPKRRRAKRTRANEGDR